MVFHGHRPAGICRFRQNFVVPLQIGAPDMAFPRRQHGELPGLCLSAGLICSVSSAFFIPGRSSTKPDGPLLFPSRNFHSDQWSDSLADDWHGSASSLHIACLAQSISSPRIISIAARRENEPGCACRFFCWGAIRGLRFLLLLAFPPLESRWHYAIDGQSSAHHEFSFCRPGPEAWGGGNWPMSGGGGKSLAVAASILVSLVIRKCTLLILPGDGKLWPRSSRTNTRKPILGLQIASSIRCSRFGFLSFIVWAHHMYLTGMGTKISTFFQTTNDDLFPFRR